MEYYYEQIYNDYVDGNLNNNNRWPAMGTADAGTGLQWNLGALAAGSSTPVTVTFWFGVPAGEEEPPTLCTNPDPPSHDFGSVPSGETRNWPFDITNCGSGTLTWSVSDDQTWLSMSPTSGTTTTETDTVTVTIDTTGLTCDTEHTGAITVNSDGGTKIGTISVYVPCAAEAYVRSSNDAGEEKDTFDLSESIYCYAGNLPQDDPEVDIYVVPNGEWNIGYSIGDDVSSDGVNQVSTDASGNIVPDPVLIWPATLVAGNYDIIVDLDQDGILDEGEPVDDITLEEGVEAVPEFSTIAIPVASILGLLFFFNHRKRREE